MSTESLIDLLKEIANSDMAMREEDEGNTSPLLDKVRAAIACGVGESKSSGPKEGFDSPPPLQSPSNDPPIQDTLAMIEKAQEMIAALCKPRGTVGAREWMMSIPARPDYDPDLVIADALRAAKAVIIRDNATPDTSLFDKLHECRAFSYKTGEPHMLKLINEAISILGDASPGNDEVHKANASVRTSSPVNTSEIPVANHVLPDMEAAEYAYRECPAAHSRTDVNQIIALYLRNLEKRSVLAMKGECGNVY